jgi:hypothetical protein
VFRVARDFGLSITRVGQQRSTTLEQRDEIVVVTTFGFVVGEKVTLTNHVSRARGNGEGEENKWDDASHGSSALEGGDARALTSAHVSVGARNVGSNDWIIFLVHN